MAFTASSVVRELIAAGVTGDALVTALERLEASSAPVRSKGAERTARWRAKNEQRHSDVTVTDCDVKKEIPHTPLEKTNNIKPTNTRASERGTRLPDPFSVEPEIFDFASKLGFTASEIKFEIEQFTDYWRGVPGAKGRKVDWNLTLKNRFRDEHKRNKSRFKRSSPGQDMRDAIAEVSEELAGAGKVVGFRNNNWP